MISQTFARNALRVTAPSGPWGDLSPIFSAQKSDDGKTLVLRYVNFYAHHPDYLKVGYPTAPRTTLNVTVTGAMGKLPFRGGATMWGLESLDPHAANPPGEPERVSPRKVTLSSFGATTVLRIPSNAYVVVVAKLE